MKLKTLFIYNTVVTFPFGVCLVLVPAFILDLYGVELGLGGSFVARLLGSALIFVALLCWFARDSEDTEARRAIVFASFLESTLGFIIALIATLSGIINLLGWLIVVLYLSIAIGYGYFQFMGEK
jgi:hypothetical protein